jgi:hypothetical protein
MTRAPKVSTLEQGTQASKPCKAAAYAAAAYAAARYAA